MKLYCDPITVNCRKVLAGFALMATDFEAVKVDYFAAEQKSPEFTAINPNQMLPALVDGDFVVWESNAILQYAADKDQRRDVYPGELRARTDINRWLLWESNRWFPACYVYLVENVVKPLLGSEPDAARLEPAAAAFHQLAAILDGALADRPWLAGEQPTLADIAVAAPMHLHTHQRLPLQDHPALRAWIERVEQLECWRQTDAAPLLGLSSKLGESGAS